MTGVQKPNQEVQVDNSTLSVNGSGQLQINPSGSPTVSSLTASTVTANTSVTTPAVNPNTSKGTLTGTTAGSITYAMPFQGASYKKFIAYANGYENTTTTAQTITFPVAFTNTPIISANGTGMSLTVSTTTLTLPASMTATATGWIVIEGF